MISVSKMKNSVYNLSGLEDSCICGHYLTEFFCWLRLLKTYKYARKWQIAVFGLTCTADKWTSGLKIKLLWKHEVQLQGYHQMALVGGDSVLRVHMTLKAQFHMILNEGWWCANYQCQQRNKKKT